MFRFLPNHEILCTMHASDFQFFFQVVDSPAKDEIRFELASPQTNKTYKDHAQIISNKGNCVILKNEGSE